MAKKSETPPPHRPLRVQRVLISFQIGRYDEDGHLLEEGLAQQDGVPIQVTLLYPYAASDLLQGIVGQIDTQINGG